VGGVSTRMVGDLVSAMGPRAAAGARSAAGAPSSMPSGAPSGSDRSPRCVLPPCGWMLGRPRCTTRGASCRGRCSSRSASTSAACARCWAALWRAPSGRRFHLLRDVLARVPRHTQAMVAGFVRTIFAQPDESTARTPLHAVVERLARSCPQAAPILARAEDVGLAYLACPGTGPRSGRATRSSASTASSPAAPAWWGSSRTGKLGFAWARPCSARSTTNS
jgi:hypothetical protein